MKIVDQVKSWLEPKLRWLKESWLEVRFKVNWPSKDEVLGTTWIVIGAVLVFALIVGAMDVALSQVLNRVWRAVA